MSRAARVLWLAVAGAGSLSCEDAVHDAAVQALGPEQPNVAPGPQHRPGQPCITCHGGSGPASLQLSVGGTVYGIRNQSAPSDGTIVQLEDIDGKVWTGKTNAAGNFFAPLSEFAPHYPLHVVGVTSLIGTQQTMNTFIYRDGSCGDCHMAKEGPLSPGRIYVTAMATGDPL